MIVLDGVSKTHGRLKARRLVLDGIDAVFHPDGHYVILGQRGSGKSTLLRLLCGIQRPTRGRVRRRCGVSLPAGSAASIGGIKTGRELAGMLARLYDADPAEIAGFTAAFSGLGEAMDFPLGSLSPIARARLGYALTYAIPTDIYLFDDAVGYGDAEFRRACLKAFESRRQQSGTIVTARDGRHAAVLGERGGVLHGAKLYLYDNIADAIAVYEELELSGKVAGLTYAEALIRKGDPDKAREHLKEHLSENDDTAEAYELLAKLSLKAGNHADAVEASSAALDRNPASADSYLVLARVAEQQGQMQVAIENAQKVLALVPDHREVRVLLAKAHESIGNNIDAAAAWRGLAAPTGDSVSLRLAIRNDLKAGNWRGVLTTVDLALAREADDAGLLAMKARSLLELRQWDDAKQTIAHLAEIDAEKAVGAIYHLTKTSDWAIIPEFLSVVPFARLSASRSSRTVTLLVTFLDRQAASERKQGRAAEADALMLGVAILEPDRQRRSEPVTLPTDARSPIASGEGSQDPAAGDLSSPDGIIRELFDLRTGRPGMTAAEFADRHKVAWAAAKAYLAGRRDNQ